MTDNGQLDLSLGHIGQAVYIEDTGSWKFSRVPGFGHSLQQVGPSRTTLPTTSSSLTLQPGQLNIIKKQVLKLVDKDPALAPIASLLPPLAQASELIDKSFSTYDPLLGDLCALGQAINLSKDRHAVDVAAVVDGSNRDVVRLVQTGLNNLRWDGGSKSYLTVRTLESEVVGYWIGNSSPIQQVCFSTNLDQPGLWLAIRSQTAITILRPLIRPELVSPYSYNASDRPKRDYPASILDANPVVVLPYSRTSLSEFADVAFNPWNQQQFAIVDIKGHWSIWNIKGQQNRRHAWDLEPGPSADDMYASPHTGEAEDGWAKLLWVRDSHTIAAAMRGSLNFYDTQFGSKVLISRQLDNLTKTDRILDVRRPSCDSPKLLVLSSARIVWVRVDKDFGSEESSSQLNITVILQCLHYRNVGDPSMQLAVASQGEFDASMLSSYQARSSTEYTLCQLLTLYADLNLTETFYIDSASNGTPLGKFQVHKSRFQISKAPTRITGESFVVPDDISSDAEVEDVKVSKRSPTLQHQRKDDPRTVSLEWLALIIRIKTAAPVKGRSSNRSSSPAKSSLDVLKNLAQITEYVERKLAGISTLSEITTVPLPVDDIDEASAILEVFRKILSTAEEGDKENSTIETSTSVEAKSLLVPLMSISLFNSEDQPESVTLLQVYEKAIQQWITSLSYSIPGRVRLHLDERLRSIMTHIFLASIGLQKATPILCKDPTPHVDNASNQLVLPIRHQDIGSSPLGKGNQRAQDDWQPRNGLDLYPPSQPSSKHGPSSSQAQSTYPQSSATSDTPAEKNESNERLRTLTTLATQPPLSKATKKVLSHWSLGTDPWTYDWEATSELLRQVEEGEEEVTDERQSRKKQRRREKQSQRRQQNDSVTERLMSSQLLPPVVQSSQFEAPPVVRSGSPISPGGFDPHMTPLRSQLAITGFGGGSQIGFGSSQVMGRIGSPRKKKRAGF
ncbi:MAG: hypothetical protein MMC33_005085 [Icmadophila ericetorum]|nr:hypothetical protein [Icmadophila ericetorum]